VRPYHSFHDFHLLGHNHNRSAPELGERHINLCVEVRNHRPWRLKDILNNRAPPLIMLNDGVVS
jgi:calcineurin-like phosphoesterase family protein